MEEKVAEQMNIQKTNKPQRMANLELLRCIAMMMVIVLHYLGKSDLLVACARFLVAMLLGMTVGRAYAMFFEVATWGGESGIGVQGKRLSQ